MPAYNEAARIRETVATTAECLRSITPSFEIVIAEDGSTDGTAGIAAELAVAHAYVLHLHSDERLGRGRALNRAFKAASGEVLAYIDVDLATDMKHLAELINAIRLEGYDFSTGSRMMPESDVKRPFKRGLASRGYNFLVRLFLQTKLYDHQCGFKAFRREALFELLEDIKDQHWFWDTELLVRAQARGYRIKEFPVLWRHGGTSKVNLVKDVLGMGSDILALWWELFASKFFSGRRKLALTFGLALLILGFIATFIGTSEIAEHVKNASIQGLLTATLVYGFSWPLRGARYQQILKRMGEKISLAILTGSIFLSQSANVVLPARIGDLSRAYILKKSRGLSLTTGLSSLAVERVFDIVAITLIAVISATGAASELELTTWMKALIQISTLVITLFFAALFFASFRESRRKNSPYGKQQGKLEQGILPKNSSPGTNSASPTPEAGRYRDKITDLASRFIGEMSVVAVRPGAFLTVLTSSLLIWAVDILTCFLVLRAFPGVELASGVLIALVFLAVALGNIAKIFPVTPGAIGTYEAALTAVFGLGGIDPKIGFAAAVLDHVIKNSVTLIGGGVSLSSFGLRWKEVLSANPETLTKENVPADQ